MNEQSAPTIPAPLLHRAPLGDRPGDRGRAAGRVGAPAGRNRADRQREHRVRRGHGGRRARCSPTNTPRATRGRRYYGGCAEVDVAEQLAIDRAKELFGCGFANVQPHSGAQANQAVFLATLKPGDTILGMSLAAGGHLTHGAAPNLSGKWFRAIQYGVRREDGLLDYEELERLARAERPRMIIAGGSAYPRAIDFPRIRAVADEVGALFLVDMAHYAGLVAAGLYPSPFPHAQLVTTTTHKTLRGPRGGMILTNDEELAKKDQLCRVPWATGWPADARDRRQGRSVRRGAAAGVPHLSARGARQRPGARGDAARTGLRHRDGGHGLPPGPGGPAAQEHDR